MQRSDRGALLAYEADTPALDLYFLAGTWSGDINTTFATFEAQVPLGLSTAMSGVPYWGTDIGGFFPTGAGPAPHSEPPGRGGPAPADAAGPGGARPRWWYEPPLVWIAVPAVPTGRPCIVEVEHR